MYAPDQIVTAVTNDDTRGNICGKTYSQRCEIAYRAEQADLVEWVKMALKTNSWLVRHSYPAANDAEILDAALSLKHYYYQHVNEG